MRPYQITLGAAGSSPWKKVDPHKRSWAMSAAVTLDATANLTYSVEYSYDDTGANIPCTISRTTTVATITFPSPHGLTTADSVIVTGTGSTNLDGSFAVASVPSSTTVTYTVSNTGITSAIHPQVSPMRVFALTALAAQTAKKDSNFTAPIWAIRLTISSYTAGSATLTALQVGEH